MKWNRKIDYHGFRTYDPERVHVPGRIGLTLAWLAAIVKRRFQGLAAMGARPPERSLLIGEGEHHFSLLGASARSPAARADDCPFPARPATDDAAH
jgi:hypothetical protein